MNIAKLRRMCQFFGIAIGVHVADFGCTLHAATNELVDLADHYNHHKFIRPISVGSNQTVRFTLSDKSYGEIHFTRMDETACYYRWKFVGTNSSDAIRGGGSLRDSRARDSTTRYSDAQNISKIFIGRLLVEWSYGSDTNVWLYWNTNIAKCELSALNVNQPESRDSGDFRGRTVDEFLQQHALSLKEGDLYDEPQGKLQLIKFRDNPKFLRRTVVLRLGYSKELFSMERHWNEVSVKSAIIEEVKFATVDSR